MTDDQAKAASSLSASPIGETDDGLLIAQSTKTGIVYLFDEHGDAWIAEWTPYLYDRQDD